MKHKIFLLLLSCVMSLSASAQFLSYEELQKLVADMNAGLPMSMGSTMQMNSVTITKDALTYRGEFYMLPSQTQSLQTNQPDEQTLRENIKNMMAGNELVKPLFKSLIALNIKAVFSFTYNSGKNEISVVFTPKDLADIMERKVTYEDKVDLIINGSKKTLPLNMMTGMSLVNMQKNGQWIEFIAEIDETIYDMGQFESNKAAMKESMVTMLKGDATAMQQCTIFFEAGYGIRYIFRGNTTHQDVVISLSQEELMALILENMANE